MSTTAPAELPVRRASSTWRVVRILVLGVSQALALALVAWTWASVSIDGVRAAVVVVAVLAVLNAVVWPFVVRVALPIVLMTVGLVTFAFNALFVWLAGELVAGFSVDSFLTALGVAVVMAVVNVGVGGLLAVDDDHVYRLRVVRRMARHIDPVERTDEPGILFVQIDGLGHDVLAEAIAAGRAPFLAELVRRGSHELVEWECDLSSQTGAMQAGILLGNNRDMPAFRWFEKESGRILVSNRPRDAADIEARQSRGDGLLVDGGVSRGNVFSGDAADAMFTFSTARQRPLRDQRSFGFVVATPYALLRIVVLMVVEVVREYREARRARRRGVEPRMHRGGVYPLLRAGTTVALAEVTYSLLMADIVRGVPSAYVDLVGYDEVAHHSGIRSDDALDTLTRIDDALARLLTAVDHAPRPYHVVVLSDHGQTQGSTFLQRYGESLDALVRRAAVTSVAAPVLAEEGWNNVNGLLTDAAAEDSRLGRLVARTTRGHTTDGEVVLGPDTERTLPTDEEIVVLASGNLGLLSFPPLPGRATRQQIEARHPGLLDTLARHPGIGFLLVRDDELGDVVLGAHGLRRLDAGEPGVGGSGDTVEGVDPLEAFGPHAADHLRRTSGFANCPDVVVNSFYDPTADEGAAFEELIGFHGGLGGAQCRPFVLAPAALGVPPSGLVGAEEVHHVFKRWRREVHPVPADA